MKNITILGGARLSGRINKKWRIGVMETQTASDSALRINAQNYFVAAVQRQVSKASNIALIAVNRQRTNRVDSNEKAYNRILGIDFNLLSANNKWVGKFFIHQSFTPGFANDWNSNANASFLNYSVNKFYFAWNHEYVGKNYLAQTGYVPRTDWTDANNPQKPRNIKMSYYRLEPEIGVRWFPKNKKYNKYINNIKFELYNDTYFDSALKILTDINVQPNIIIAFQSSAEFRFEFNNLYTYLMFPQYVLPNNGSALSMGGYSYQNFSIGYTTNKRKKLNGNIYAIYGGFYNGTRHSAGIDIYYRIQPYGILTLNY
ncbi:MAG: hypothetical protein HYZ42_15635, partial [Bacteroidetes bacterium]|nr:hypothetical protein [Bacteroidota bacterium]